MITLDQVNILAAKIEDREVTELGQQPVERSYIILYDVKAGEEDTLGMVLMKLNAVRLSHCSYGFMSNLTPTQIEECILEEMKTRYDRFWIVSAATPFSGFGEDIGHDWLWAMPQHM